MENIILCGCSASERRIANSLAACASVQYFGENTIWRRGTGKPEIVICSAVQLPKTENLPGILVLGSELREQEFPPQPLLVPVFDSRSTVAARLLFLWEGVAISCGTSPRDTISLASFSGQKAVISLQRNLTALGGGTVEPRDITVSLGRSGSVFEVMAFCAVMLLYGADPDREFCLK